MSTDTFPTPSPVPTPAPAASPARDKAKAEAEQAIRKLFDDGHYVEAEAAQRAQA